MGLLKVYYLRKTEEEAKTKGREKNIDGVYNLLVSHSKFLVSADKFSISCETISHFFPPFDWNSICLLHVKNTNLFQWLSENSLFFYFHHVRLLFNEVYGGVQWRKKRSLKDLSDWNLFVVDSSNGFVRAHILYKQQRSISLFSQNKNSKHFDGKLFTHKTKPQLS